MKKAALALAIFAMLAGFARAKSNVDALLETAQELINKGDYEKALETFDKALCMDPPKKVVFDILLNMADLEFDRLERPEDALKHLLMAKNLYPERHKRMDEVYYRLGLVYEKLGRYVDAAKSFETVATKYRKSKYFNDALDGVERCFRKNFKEYVAVAGGEPITRLEFDERLENIPPFFRSRYESEEGKKELLDRMIDEILITKEAEARKLYLLADVRKELEQERSKVLQRQLFEKEIREKVKVPEKEIVKYYRENREKYKSPARVTFRRIVVKDRKTAEEVLKKARAGEPFDSLVAEYSVARDAKSGGLMQNLTKGSEPKALVETGFKLKEGQISDIIALDDTAFAIIKVVRKEPTHYKSLDEVRSQIEGNLKSKLEMQKWEEFRKALRKKYGVQYVEDLKKEAEEVLEKSGRKVEERVEDKKTEGKEKKE